MYDNNNPVIVIPNGEFPPHEIPINYLKNCNHIICADGAADKIKEFGLEPNVVIGDFDSIKISSKERLGSWIEIPDQNKTDLEKTFEWCISKNIKKPLVDKLLFGNLKAGGVIKLDMEKGKLKFLDVKSKVKA